MNDHTLDRDWSAGALLRFAAPSIAMMIFMGLYTIVDTIFAARFINTDALSAINIVCPVLNVTVGLGTMLATGGNAIISRKIGAGDIQAARENFTLIILAGAGTGLFLLLGGTLWTGPILRSLGASDRLFPYCRDYLTVLCLFLPANVLQTLFSNLFATEGRPGLGLGLSVLGGTANILFDYIFIVRCGLGIRGAALGTGLGVLLPAAAGLTYFARGGGVLFFTKTTFNRAVLWESCLNGSSEMVSQLAAAITTLLFNLTMMDLLGEDGVAAITIMSYSQFLLNTLYIGFSIGAAPVIGFCFGTQNGTQLRKVVQISMRFLAAASVLTFALSRLCGPCLVRLFAAETSEVYQITVSGFSIFVYSFLFCGLNIFTSAMFTALSNGKVSAVLSFLRTFVLLAGFILLLPRIWRTTGVWLAVPAAEGTMFVLSALCLIRNRARYRY